MELAAKWAEKNNVLFPPSQLITDVKNNYLENQGNGAQLKECYVFKHPTDPHCPTVLHFILINKRFRDYKEPGKN